MVQRTGRGAAATGSAAFVAFAVLSMVGITVPAGAEAAVPTPGPRAPRSETCAVGDPTVSKVTRQSGFPDLYDVTIKIDKGNCGLGGEGATWGGYYYLGNELGSDGNVNVPRTESTITFTNLHAGARYRFRAYAAYTNQIGGPLSWFTEFAAPPFTTVTAFLRQQYRDFAGRNPTADEQNSAHSRLVGGDDEPPEFIAKATDFAWTAKQAPVVRLFKAYFLRLPDIGGLTYWTNKSRGGLGINAISSNFAASSEFKNKYGSLSNHDFVALVYQNVLGRSGDAGGISYWTGKLNSHAKTRGQVMVGFSESNEFKTDTYGLTSAVNTIRGMYGRLPTEPEVYAWRNLTPSSRPDAIAGLMESKEYADRIIPA